MSFFSKVMASVGIGAAKVDTLLEKRTYQPGEEMNGIIRIQGGQVQQEIEGIDLSIMTYYIKEVDDRKVRQNVELGKVRATPSLVIAPGETKEEAFSFRLPLTTPLSIGRTPVWVQTKADIRSAIDPTDQDRIEVVPAPIMSAVIDGFERLGFRLREVETVYAPRLGGAFPFVQEFEWVPSGGSYRGRLDEVELVFLRQQGDGLELLLQVDRRATSIMGLFAEAMDMDESFVRMTVTEAEAANGVDYVAGLLDQVIGRYA